MKRVFNKKEGERFCEDRLFGESDFPVVNDGLLQVTQG